MRMNDLELHTTARLRFRKQLNRRSPTIEAKLCCLHALPRGNAWDGPGQRQLCPWLGRVHKRGISSCVLKVRGGGSWSTCVISAPAPTQLLNSN